MGARRESALDARNEGSAYLLGLQQRIAHERKGKIGKALAQAWDDRCQVARPSTHAQSQLLVVELPQQVDKRLGDGADRRMARIVPGRGEHNRAVLDPPRDFEHQTRLADPRLALDDDHPPATGRDRPPHFEDVLLLAAPAHERKPLRRPRRQNGYEVDASGDERGVVMEDALMQALQARSRIDAELLDQ